MQVNKKRIPVSILLLTILLLIGSILPAAAAPTKMQVDFVSRMSEYGFCVQMGGMVYYAQGDAIYRMSSKGASAVKRFEIAGPRDLQIYSGSIYFISEDKDAKTYTLYRFGSSSTKPTKVLDGVYDAVIGGEVLYYTNADRDVVSSWNLRTGVKRTMYDKLFGGACDMNYMQNMLTFTATMNDAENTSCFVYSPQKDSATYYSGSAKGMLAYNSFLYMPEGNDIIRVTFDASKPSITKGKAFLEGLSRCVISEGRFYYQKSDEAAKKGYVYKRTIGSSLEKLVYEYNLAEHATLYLEPAGDYIWAFSYDDTQGAKYIARLTK